MRHYDHTVNVKWVMAHYNAAGKYLEETINSWKPLEEVVGENTYTQNIEKNFLPLPVVRGGTKNWGAF